MKIHQIRIDFQVTEQVKRYVFVYILEAKNCYLIDSGVYGSQGLIIDYIHKIGRNLKDVKGILLTHAHPDHIGTAAWFKKETGCIIYAAAGEKAWIEDINLQFKERPIPNFYHLAGESVAVDVTITDKDRIELEEGLVIEVVEAAGHSYDEVSYVVDEAMFIGDSVPVKGDIPIYIDVKKSLESLDKIERYDKCSAFYPAWDTTYSREEMLQKVHEAKALIAAVDEAVKKATAKSVQIDEITKNVCDILGKPLLLSNPLFKRTIQAHMKK